MTERLKRALSALLDSLEFWAVYLFFLLACAIEPDEADEADTFDPWERP